METGQERKHTGGPLALAAAALFGASTPIAKLLLGVTDPLLLAGLLYLGSGGGLAVVSVIGRARSRNHTEAPLRRADLAWLAAVVLFGGILGPALLVWGLVVTPASAASLLLNVEALATMAIAWIVFRENRPPDLCRRHGDPRRRARPTADSSRGCSPSSLRP